MCRSLLGVCGLMYVFVCKRICSSRGAGVRNHHTEFSSPGFVQVWAVRQLVLERDVFSTIQGTSLAPPKGLLYGA